MFNPVNISTCFHRMRDRSGNYKRLLSSPDFALLKKIAGEVSHYPLAGPPRAVNSLALVLALIYTQR